MTLSTGQATDLAKGNELRPASEYGKEAVAAAVGTVIVGAGSVAAGKVLPASVTAGAGSKAVSTARGVAKETAASATSNSLSNDKDKKK